MAHIKEPKGIDIIIKSEPLTDTDRAAISAYIHNYKAAVHVSKKKSRGQALSNNNSILANPQ